MYMPDGHIGLLFYIHAEQYLKKRGYVTMDTSSFFL